MSSIVKYSARVLSSRCEILAFCSVVSFDQLLVIEAPISSNLTVFMHLMTAERSKYRLVKLLPLPCCIVSFECIDDRS